MNKICNLLSDKKGAGTIMAMGLALIILIIAVPFIGFMTESFRVFHIKQSVQSAADNYTTDRGKIIVQSVKSGHDYSSIINEMALLNDIQESLELRSKYKGYDKNGRLIYQIKDISVKFIIDKTLKTEMSYTLEYHYYFMSEPLFQSDIEIKQHSLYNLKYD